MTIYFLRCLNVIKIGIASSFPTRLDAIRRGNFHPIEVLRVYSNWDENWIRQLEREIHKELSGVCEHHEFFHDGAEVQAVIERLDKLFHPEQFSVEPLTTPTQVQA